MFNFAFKNSVKRFSRMFSCKNLAIVILSAMVLSYLPPLKTYAAATYQNTWTTSGRITSAGTLTLSQSISPTSGNLLIAALSTKVIPTSTPTMAGWTARDFVCNVVCTYVFTKTASTTGAQTVSIDLAYGAAGSGILTVIEYSQAVNNYLGATTKTGTSSAPDTASITPSSNNELLFAVFAGNNGNNYGAFSNSFVERANAKYTVGGASYQLNIGYAELATNTASTAYSTTTSFGGTAEWSSIIFRFEGVNPPVVTNVTSSTTNGSYKVGDTISIQTTFDSSVTVSGSPRLLLETGTTDRYATYVSGSPGTTLTFQYIVQSGDLSGDLDYVATNSLELNGGTINATTGGAAATLTLATPGAAGSLGANKAIVIDGVVPAAPGTPDLTNASDTGSSNTDNITSDTTPDFTVSCETSTTVRVYSGATLIGTGTCVASTVLITSSALTPDAIYSITATQQDAAGNLSSASSALLVTIDSTSPAAPGTPDLTNASDTGSSNTDNITSDTTPISPLPVFLGLL